MTNLKISLVKIFGVIACLYPGNIHAQDVKKERAAYNIYRETPPKINDLVHTRLDVRFDYKKCFLFGREWITLKPHFYPTDTLRLDAKGMDIKNISMIKNGKNIPLRYKYQDSLSLTIKLDKIYRNNETYIIYIDYTSKPNLLKGKGGKLLTEAKGLYFINPDGKEKNKPVQIWTQGETEGSSTWFPTIDKPNQKTTEEISMTVPAKYVTLSNGRLTSQKNNSDGTRTDTWKMELPHSPYLFMMAVGDFKIYHDKWRNKELNYYLEPKYAPYAKEIFRYTPEAMEFYSQKLGVDYPWNSYSQVVVRDFAIGAMENTTATIHGEQVQLTHREMIDANLTSEVDIVHELFHQWFGDYVTPESWSNLTLSESLADFSELLWMEYKHGKDDGGRRNYEGMETYFRQAENAAKPLVRFYYDDKEDVFDAVSYQKGGRILNMLRNYLGSDAFFKGLHIYLTRNAFKNAEADQLRLAFEEASGLDLTWFFNQWYFGSGHPVLNINYKWDDAAKTETVYLAQQQAGQIFKLPMAIDIYADGKTERHDVWMKNKADTFIFHSEAKPDLVNVDGDKILLAEKRDSKTLDEYAFQYFNAPLYMDRHESIAAASKKQTEKNAQKILLAALNDKYYVLRQIAIGAIDLKNSEVSNAALPILILLAESDKNAIVRSKALNALAGLKIPGNMDLFKRSVKSDSYAVQAVALTGIAQLDAAQAMLLAKELEKDNVGKLTQAIADLYAEHGDTNDWHFIYNQFLNANMDGKFNLLDALAAMAGRVDSSAYAKEGIEALKNTAIKYKSHDAVPPYVIDLLNNIKGLRAKMADTEAEANAENAIKVIKEAIGAP